MTLLTRSVAVGALVGALGLVGATSVAAATGSDFAEHVRTCEAAMGFSGEHNPGVMHQGFSSWSEMHGC